MTANRRRSTRGVCMHSPISRHVITAPAVVMFLLTGCGFSNSSAMSGAGGATATSGGGGTVGGTGSGGAAGSGSTGTGSSGATGGLTGTDASVPIGGAPGGVYACTPGVEQLVITDCGYPTTT